MAFNRRRFIASTSAVAVATPLIGAQEFSAKHGIVVTEAQVPESRVFASIIEPSARIDCQLGDVMRLQKELNEALLSGAQILGATQEAGALVIEELLRGQPYRLDILGRHRQIDPSTIRHELSGQTITDSRAMFETYEWPAKLAQSLMSLSEAWMTHRVCFDIAMPRPAASSGYLTTWRIVRT